MPLASRRGLTLPDLLCGLVLFGLLATLVGRTMLSVGRTVRAARGRATLAGGFATALGYLATELADIGPGDVVRAAPESLEYRAIRGVGLACGVSDSTVTVPVGRFIGPRLPQPGRDSLLLYVGPDPAGTGDWLPGPVRGMTRTRCGGEEALHLVTRLDPARLLAVRGAPLLPMRIYEIMQARLYASLGSHWLGGRSVTGTEVIQPIAGPFTRDTSRFEYFDSLGHPALLPRSVRGIGIRLAGRAPGWQGGAPVADSARFDLYPRNLDP